MNGHVHALTSYVLAVPVGLTAGLLARDLAAGALAAVGCVAGVLLSPDLDHEAITESEALVYRRGGQVLGSLWRTYWMPYALLIPHRHWLSHAPLIGTLYHPLLPFEIDGGCDRCPFAEPCAYDTSRERDGFAWCERLLPVDLDLEQVPVSRTSRRTQRDEEEDDEF